MNVGKAFVLIHSVFGDQLTVLAKQRSLLSHSGNDNQHPSHLITLKFHRPSFS